MISHDTSTAGDSRSLRRPKVSVKMITYNHAPYIRQALDSVLMQKRDFPIEICIGEDQSSDGTREICQEYAARHPDIIRLFLRDRSDPARKQYAAPFMHNSIETTKACRGEYIALLEGDDYWTDPDKLRLQVEFLDSHPDCLICCHNVVARREDGSAPDALMFGADQKELSSFQDLLLGNFVVTCSAMFRKDVGGFPEWATHLAMGDWPLWLDLSRRGLVGFLPKPMAVYRIHGGGVWSSLSLSTRTLEVLRVYEALRPVLAGEERRLLEPIIARQWNFLRRCLARDLVRSGRLCGLKRTAQAFLRNARFEGEIPPEWLRNVSFDALDSMFLDAIQRGRRAATLALLVSLILDNSREAWRRRRWYLSLAVGAVFGQTALAGLRGMLRSVEGRRP